MDIFNGRKQTLVDTIGILSGLRMRGLHDKRHLLAKLHICGSENYLPIDDNSHFVHAYCYLLVLFRFL